MLCIANSIITAHLQSNAAASVCSDAVAPVIVGIVMCVMTLAVTVGPVKRISDVTVRLIPFLSAVYIFLSVGIIVLNASRLPQVISDIFTSAFSFRAAAGGVGGYGITRALRFGVSRGILSNEAAAAPRRPLTPQPTRTARTPRARSESLRFSWTPSSSAR